MSKQTIGQAGNVITSIAALGLIIHGSAGMLQRPQADLLALREIQLWSGIALIGLVMTRDDRQRHQD